MGRQKNWSRILRRLYSKEVKAGQAVEMIAPCAKPFGSGTALRIWVLTLSASHAEPLQAAVPRQRPM